MIWALAALVALAVSVLVCWRARRRPRDVRRRALREANKAMRGPRGRRLCYRLGVDRPARPWSFPAPSAVLAVHFLQREGGAILPGTYPA